MRSSLRSCRTSRKPLTAPTVPAAVVVKDDVGRRRYIAFTPPPDAPSRHALNSQLGDRAWRLTVYTDEVGILRVPHTDVDAARERLTDLGAEPVTTSGTIKTAKRRAGVLDG